MNTLKKSESAAESVKEVDQQPLQILDDNVVYNKHHAEKEYAFSKTVDCEDKVGNSADDKDF